MRIKEQETRLTLHEYDDDDNDDDDEKCSYVKSVLKTLVQERIGFSIKYWYNFDVLLTVHLTIILVTDQLDAQNLVL